MPQVQYGDPERDELKASEEDLRQLKEHPGYYEIKAHFREWLELYKDQLAQRDVPQRQADILRGNIEICESFLGEGNEDSLLDMLILLAQEQKEHGRRSGTNQDRRRRRGS